MFFVLFLIKYGNSNTQQYRKAHELINLQDRTKQDYLIYRVENRGSSNQAQIQLGYFKTSISRLSEGNPLSN